MAVTVSGLFVDTYLRQLKQQSWTGTGGLDHTLTTIKIALLSNSATPNFSTTSPAWSSTNEVSGTGWASGGVALSAAASGATSTAPTVTESPTGSIMWDMGDVAVSGTTLTNARACQFYFDAITAPYADPLAVLVNFGADYSTVAGVFGITWAATGVFALDVTP